MGPLSLITTMVCKKKYQGGEDGNKEKPEHAKQLASIQKKKMNQLKREIINERKYNTRKYAHA